ncbi:choloylglycine hydrolase family protein [Acetobacterium bakii]|uniref:Choloylglycine hydrolase/NAAA C-terminal domain-containing protein n=1 Tax=Acetobacterium bakii TaxID=52689 RepID=A0A0L6TVL2_9FIRM|nr:choloylglycine hydrolase family protein [Acetobacterium bakii]KNZ40309.1 hypothetical protein AKG39_18095 [Acetobacterium bakii]
MCTSLTLTTKDHLNLLARTMDFAFVLEPELIFVPRKYPFVFEMDASSHSVTYALMGIGQQQDNTYAFTDGVNEAGLACATLYFPGYAHYSEGIIADKTNLASYEVVGWLLANFATIDEVKEAVSQLNIVNAPAKLFGVVTPLHWIVTDKSGAAIVIEPMESGLVVYDNPLGVMSNSPDFNWHMTNIRNYIGINPFKIEALKLNGLTFAPFGNGARTIGLPGDYTPPSRFIRALFGKEAINELDNEDEGIKAAFHILASVDIPKGSVITDEGVDYTQYTACMVCNTGTYYIKTYDNNQIIRACLFNEDLNADAPKVRLIPQTQQYGKLN